MIDPFKTLVEKYIIGEILTVFKKPSRLGTRAWAESRRYLSSSITSRPGKMNCMLTPWMLYVMECFDNPKIRTIVGKKSAQISWTEVTLNFIGKIIELDPRNIMISFPRNKSLQKFYKEKLKPLIESTEPLKNLVGNLTRVSHSHIPFPNGFISLANLGSAEDAKSSVIPNLFVEEPDGVKANVNNQGDGIALLIQRMKSFCDGKLIYAGTPTNLEFSQVCRAYEDSNRMVYMVPCHRCKVSSPLSFDNLKCDVYQDRKISSIYGKYNPNSAYYLCPECKEPWTFEEKNKNVLKAIEFFNKGWVATNNEEEDVIGFHFTELLSSFEASSFVNLMKLKLKADVAYEQGNEGLLKSFVNNSMGEGYQTKQVGVSVKDLIAARKNYPEFIVPLEGLVLTCGIDVQHNRFALVVRAWGRNENSWLVCWTEIFGDVLDWENLVWKKLIEFVEKPWEHAAGKTVKLKIQAVTIDCADGNTSELVYRWALQMAGRGHPHILCGQGRGESLVTDYEIFNEPINMQVGTNVQARKSLAATMGVNVYEIGAHRAHSEVLRRFNLKGKRDRHYHNETSYGGYEEQILSCIRVLTSNGQRTGYIKKPSQAKEGIDCEKMALHAAYAIQLRNYTEVHWAKIESYLHSQLQLT